MSLVDTQTSIEYTYSKKRIGKMIRDDINNTPEILIKLTNCLCALTSHYLMGPHFNQKNQYLSSITETDLSEIMYRILEIVMPESRGVTFSSVVGQCTINTEDVNRLDAFKIISSVISYMYFHGLLNIIRAGDSNTGMMEIVPAYVCDPKITKYIADTLYLPPMVCAPQKLTHNKSTGYLTLEPESLILKGYNHHDGNICIDSLNKFNQIALSLDIQMLTTFDDEYKTSGKTRSGKEIVDSPQRQDQFIKLMENSYHVYKLLIQTGNNFHLTHKVDKRGRTYSQGYHCSTQGNSFRKAIINLAEQEIVSGHFL
jgi:hypothetical protein